MQRQDITTRLARAVTTLSLVAALETGVNAAGNYLFEASGSILYRSLSGGDGAENFPANARVRPVVTVSIAKE